MTGRQVMKEQTAQCQSRVQPVPKSNAEHNNNTIAPPDGALVRIRFIMRSSKEKPADLAGFS
jgi:hypothetical protein